MKKIIVSLCLSLCFAAFAAPQIKHLSSLKSYRTEQLTNVTSVIIVFEDADSKTINSKRISNFKFQITNLNPLFPDTSTTRLAQSSDGKLSPAAKNFQNMYTAEIVKGANIADVINELNAMPEVKYAEPDYPISLFAAPNDPYFNDEWALNNTGQSYPAVIDGQQTTEAGTADADIDWLEEWEKTDFPTNEVVVAVIDTGVDYYHEELVNQMWINTNEIPRNGIDDDHNGFIDDYYGYNFFDDNYNPMDDNGHGTHCAGTIGAETANGIGIAGIFPYVKIMAVKFLDYRGSGLTSDGVKGIKYAADNGAKVINNSWGSGGRLQSLNDAINYANEKGCAVISAAGNNSSSDKIFPAAYDFSMAVAATTSKDKIADFSNYGTWISVSAPGKNILSLRAENTDMYGLIGQPVVHIINTNLYLADGTSMAAPHVAGAAALLASANPGYKGWIYGRVIAAAADNIDAENPDYVGVMGSGRINVDNLLNYEDTSVFINASLPLISNFSGEFLAPNLTTNISVFLGTWKYDVPNVTVVISNLTDGIVLSTNLISLGTIAGKVSTNLPDDSVMITTHSSKEPTQEKILVQVLSNGILMDETTLSFYIFNGFAGSVTIADLDNDGEKEFVTTYDNQLIVYDSEGYLKWFFQSPGYMMPFFEAAVGDIDGDGFLEVIAGHNVAISSGDIGLYVFEHDGAIKPGWPVNDNAASFGVPTIADVDEDGIDDIVVTCTVIINGTNSSALNAYKADTTRLWSRIGGTDDSYPAAVGDLDNDGWPEFVNIFCQNEGGNGKIFVTKNDGEDFGTTISLPPAHYVHGSPALGDIDGDGDLEILVNVYQSGGVNNKIYAYYHDGTIVPGWPKDSGSDWLVKHQTPRLVDIDGDGDQEIFAGAWQKGVYGWQGDGSILANFPITDTECRSQVCAEDIDNDGEIEFVYSISRTETIIRARKLDGSIVPGFDSLTIADDGEVRDMAIEPINGKTNQQIAVIGGGDASMFYTELFIIDTGYPSNQLHSAWPNHPHDYKKTRSVKSAITPPFVCSFKADHTKAISSMDAEFTAYLKEPFSSNAFCMWDFNNDGIIDAEGVNLFSTNAVYSLGSHSVSLTVSNGLGEVYTKTRSNYLSVIPPVECNFSANILTADAPFIVYFSDLSTNQPQYWAWDFNGDNEVDSYLQNPSYVYSATGTFSVSLTVSNNFGLGGASTATETKPDYIVVPEIADSSVHYVSKTGSHLFPYKNWSEAATNIQAAVFSAKTNELVLVTNGVYVSENTIYISNVVVKSVNGAENTVIQGTRTHGCVNIIGTYALIDGFTIQYGADTEGAGAKVMFGASVKNCIVNDNDSGIYNGGGIFCHYIPGVIENCLIVSNSGDHGSAIYAKNDYTIKNCIIKNNKLNPVSFSETVFMYNSRMLNCLINNNDSGDRVLFLRDGAIVENCTIVGNKLPYSDVAIEIFLSGFVYNSIIFNNDSGRCTNRYTDSLLTYWNSCFDVLPVQTYLGDGNFALNPMFISQENEDYFLKALSPCINSGSNYFVSVTNDIYGRSRIIDGNVDMGCIENDVSFSMTAPEIISPTNISSGESGVIVFDSPGQDVIIEGYKNSGSLVYLEENLNWADDNILQNSAGSSWSNILYNIQEETSYTLNFKSMNSNFTNASPDSTELIIEVIPEPGILWIIGLIPLLSRMSRS